MIYETNYQKNNISTLPVCALGYINYDFETEYDRDSFIQLMTSSENLTPNPYDPKQILDYLTKNPNHSTSLIWTICYKNSTICAIKPSGMFAWYGYVILKNLLSDKINNIIQTISISGTISGTIGLVNGSTIPVLIPDLSFITDDRLIS